MKIKYLTLGILLSLASCAVFKKTNKLLSSQSSAKQMEMNELLFKQANKETQIITYWNDSGFYQIQHVKEHIDETKSGQLKVKDKQVNEAKIVAKKSEPVRIWMWIGLIVVGALWFWKSLK